MSHNSIFILNGLEIFFLLYTQIKYYDFLVTMHLLFLVFVIGSPLFVRGYSYDKVTGIVKCPDESFGSEFDVTELDKNFTKVNRTMLINYRISNHFEKFTTSCTTNVTDMKDMFRDLGTFNSSISKWDTSSVTDMSQMFKGATSFNSDISNWNTSNVDDMSYMFFGAHAFNSSISKWDTSSVLNMRGMFWGAESFNSDISNWTTSNVTDMYNMLKNATSFNQSLTNWCVNISVPTDFSLHSPIENNTAFQPLWNGAGCTNKCYNGIRNTSDYSCTCNSGHLGPTCALTPDITITVTNKDSTAYHFNSNTVNNPTLNLATSTTYYFELGATMTSHPFQLLNNDGTQVGTNLSTGVLLTTDPVAANYTYKCIYHPAMTGTILSSKPVSTTEDSINVNLIIGLVSGGVVLAGLAFFVVYKCFFLEPTSGYTLTAM